MGKELTSSETKVCNTSINKFLLSPLASDLHRVCHTDTVKCVCMHTCTQTHDSVLLIDVIG
jgi:hypothetical protein